MKKRFLVLCSMTLFLLSAYSSTSFADQKAGESKTYTVDDINNGFTNYLIKIKHNFELHSKREK